MKKRGFQLGENLARRINVPRKRACDADTHCSRTKEGRKSEKKSGATTRSQRGRMMPDPAKNSNRKGPPIFFSSRRESTEKGKSRRTMKMRGISRAMEKGGGVYSWYKRDYRSAKGECVRRRAQGKRPRRMKRIQNGGGGTEEDLYWGVHLERSWVVSERRAPVPGWVAS